MIIYVVYEDAGWGDKSAPRACFSTIQKTKEWVRNNPYGAYEILELDEDEDTED